MRYHYLIIVILAATCGALLNRAGAWIVHHDRINYSLPKVISTAAEIANVLGPLLWIAGVVLAAPLALGLVRNVTSFWKLVAIGALAYLSLVCGMGSPVHSDCSGSEPLECYCGRWQSCGLRFVRPVWPIKDR